MANTKKTNNSTKSTAKNESTKKVNTTKKSTTKKSNTTNTKKGTAKTTKITKEVVKPVEVVKETTKDLETVKVVAPTKKVNFKDTLKENATLILLCIICLLLIVNIVIVVVGHRAKLVNGKEIIASLDGKEITTDEVYNKIKVDYGTNALVNMIDEFIISKEIKDADSYTDDAKEQVEGIKKQYESAGYKWNDVLSNYGYASEDALLDEIKLSLLQEAVVVSYLKEDITDDEINKYYEEEIYGDYTVKHILIQPEAKENMTDDEKAAAEELAKNTATEVINKLNNGEAWADLVKNYSDDDGSKENEGLIENFTKGDMVDAFFDATLKLENGKYTTEPVKSEYGYHVILKISNTEKDKLEDVKEEIIEALVNKKLGDDENLYAKTWADIRKVYDLKINDTEIENKYNTLIKGE